eukprot:1214151-Amphidinium_carterae.1
MTTTTTKTTTTDDYEHNDDGRLRRQRRRTTTKTTTTDDDCYSYCCYCYCYGLDQIMRCEGQATLSTSALERPQPASNRYGLLQQAHKLERAAAKAPHVCLSELGISSACALVRISSVVAGLLCLYVIAWSRELPFYLHCGACCDGASRPAT